MLKYNVECMTTVLQMKDNKIYIGYDNKSYYLLLEIENGGLVMTYEREKKQFHYCYDFTTCTIIKIDYDKIILELFHNNIYKYFIIECFSPGYPNGASYCGPMIQYFEYNSKLTFLKTDSQYYIPYVGYDSIVAIANEKYIIIENCYYLEVEKNAELNPRLFAKNSHRALVMTIKSNDYCPTKCANRIFSGVLPKECVPLKSDIVDYHCFANRYISKKLN